jgi:hypothetical protein
MTDEQLEEQVEGERKQAVFYESQQAQLILGNPLVMRFFEQARADFFQAFQSLPIDASLEEYKVVHLGLRAMKEFESKFKEYILKQEHEVLTEFSDHALNGVNI